MFTLLSLWTCLLHCTLKSSCLPFQWTLITWSVTLVCVSVSLNRNFCCSAFRALIQKYSFSVVLFFLLPVVGVLSLENCEEEAEKLILLAMYFQERTTWCDSSFIPKAPQDTAQQGGCSCPTAWSGGRDENWARRPSPCVALCSSQQPAECLAWWFHQHCPRTHYHTCGCYI